MVLASLWQYSYLMKPVFLVLIFLAFTTFAESQFERHVAVINYHGQRCYQEMKRVSPSPQTVDYLIYDYDDGYGYQRPLYLNEHYLQTTLQNILRAMPPEFKAYLAAPDLKLCAQMNFKHVKDTIGRIEWLETRVRRLTYLKSQREKYEGFRRNDVRGYLILRDEIKRDANFKNHPVATVTLETFKHLLGMCMNSGATRSECTGKMQPRLTVGTIFDRYREASEYEYNSFLSLRWPSKFKGISTLNVGSQKSLNLLLDLDTVKHTQLWNFLKSFIPSVWTSKEIKVQPIISDELDATPVLSHKDAFGGNLTAFVMSYEFIGTRELYLNFDTDYNTITGRYLLTHELGHIIGFPDCYVEFYEAESDSFVSYSIDESNIMCSGRGRVLPGHFKKIQKEYFR